MKAKRKSTYTDLIGLVVLLVGLTFGMLVFRDETNFDIKALIVAAILIALMLVHFVICTKIFKKTDKPLLIIIYILSAIGMIMQYRINPDIANKQLIWISIGMGGMIVAMIIFSKLELLMRAKYVLVGLGVIMLIAVAAAGATRGGAKNWFDVGGFSFQPSEFVKIILVLVLGSFFGETQGETTTQTIKLFLPALAFVACCVIILALSRDLGMALIYTLTCIIVFFCATSNYVLTTAGLLGGAIASYGSYFAFSHVRIRVAAWQNPFSSFQTNGYQIAQGLMAIASGGLFGMGLTLGTPKIIPAYHTDYIFAVICEEMGMIVGICVILLYFIFAIRAMNVAKTTKSQHASLMAVGIASIFALQSFLIIGGVIKMIPLTGVTMPFVSYGGSSVIASFVLIGLLQAILVQSDWIKES